MQHAGWDVIVVGAGVFGAWTAEILRRNGQRVLLVDAWGSANARASSGGESRMTRGIYGADEIYSAMALNSLEDWKRLSHDADLPLFHKIGVLASFDQENDYARASLKTLKTLGTPVDVLEPSTLMKKWPQLDWSGVAFGLYEPGFGALMARRAVTTLLQTFVRNGGYYRQVMIAPPRNDEPLTVLRTDGGDELRADAFVFACGPWLKELFSELLGDLLFATRQEIYYFRPPGGDMRFASPSLPGLVDFIGERIFYGFPDLENRGFKIADDALGPVVDFNANDRLPSREMLETVRTYMKQRLPALKNAPLSEARVCQYENSQNGDFLIDRHPEFANAILVGMGSGHGFKHGPAVGKCAAALVLDNGSVEPRFSLGSKSTQQGRTVH